MTVTISFVENPPLVKVYVLESGAGGGGVAVRVGGSKDVTASHVVWSGRQSGRMGTPVLYKNRLYSFSGGVAQCYAASTGDEDGQLRLTNQHLYCVACE